MTRSKSRVNLRLFGIDAPELKQDCPDGFRAGSRAYEYMLGLVMGATVTCTQVDYDAKYNRPVVLCHNGKIEINSVMVEAGWAWAYRKYSQSYVPLEDEARAMRRGVWAHNCVPPWTWRPRGPIFQRNVEIVILIISVILTIIAADLIGDMAHVKSPTTSSTPSK